MMSAPIEVGVSPAQKQRPMPCSVAPPHEATPGSLEEVRSLDVGRRTPPTDPARRPSWCRLLLQPQVYIRKVRQVKRYLLSARAPSSSSSSSSSLFCLVLSFIRLLRPCGAGLVDTETLIKGLRSGVIRQAGLDVYENEAPYFFKDCSDTPVQVRDT